MARTFDRLDMKPCAIASATVTELGAISFANKFRKPLLKVPVAGQTIAETKNEHAAAMLRYAEVGRYQRQDRSAFVSCPAERT
jgi:hypothetical protein